MSQQLLALKSIVSTMSWPLKMNSFQISRGDGLRASEGSWYLSVIVVPSACDTELDTAARTPVDPKLGFSLGFSGSSPVVTAKESA